MVRYKMTGRDVDCNPTQYRAWVSNTPDLTGEQYTGVKSGPNPLVDILVYLILDDTVVADFNLPLGDTWAPAYRVLPSAVSDSQVAVIDGYIYLFGGSISNKIYQASVQRPAEWIDTGATLPTALYGSQLALIDGYAYLFGGNDGYGPTSHIFSASTADPLSWTDHGPLLPRGLQYSAFGMYGGTLYLFGGQDGYGATKSIFIANAAGPLDWIESGGFLPAPLYGSQLAQLDGYWVLMGGDTAPNTPTPNIWRTPVVEPYLWSLDGYLPYPTAFGQFFPTGSSGFLIAPMVGATFTGFTPIVSYNSDNYLQFVDIQSTLPGVVSSPQVVIIDDRLWMLGGNAESAIFVCQQELKYDYYDPVASSYGYHTRILLQSTDNQTNPFQALGIPYWKTNYNF